MTMEETDIIIDGEQTETIDTPIYTFDLRHKTHPDYRCCSAISEWIKSNLEDLTDDCDDPLFSKVNYGYNNETIKGFGKKPVADVYIDNLTYSTDFDNNKPETVNSFIICYFKGNMNNARSKCHELADYLIQQFEENSDFRELDCVVRSTSVENLSFETIPNGKTYGVLCAFELQHKLF